MRTTVLDNISDIVDIAVTRTTTAGVLYTNEMFRNDISSHLTKLVQLGVPPIGSTVGLPTVFNVGQVLCCDHLDSFRPGVEDASEKERRVDDLLLKAIELNDIATTWAEVKV